MTARDRRFATSCLACVMFASACTRDAPDIVDPGRGENIDLALDWTTAPPLSQGVDPDLLDDAISHAGTLPRLLSVVVVRHGRIVAEEYFNGNHADSLNDVRSVTKTVVSTLVGIAVREGLLTGVDARIADYMTPPLPQMTAEQSGITFRDLLTMSSGFEWFESGGVGYNDWILSGNWIGYLLARPIVAPPGTTFNYNSAAVHLLGVALQQAVGMRLDEFADRHLFAMLGVARVRWEEFPDGLVNGASGIDLRPRDLAKLGQLWLQGGDAVSSRILSPEWVVEGTTATFPYWQAGAPFADQGYGWLWWLTRTPPAPAHLAWGHGGQFIWVVPERDVVIVVTNEWRGAGPSVSQVTGATLDLIVNRLLPAVR